jgi:hypothetical protein
MKKPSLILDSNRSVSRITVATVSLVLFVVFSIAAGFSLSTGRDFRVILVLGSLLFALPFGYCIYKTFLSILGFVAFGLTFLLSAITGFSAVNTILFSFIACLATSFFITAGLIHFKKRKH